jgi:hypothetical protein
LLGGAQLRGNGESVLARQHDVEDDDIEDATLFEQQVERLLAVGGDERLVALGFEVEAQTVGDVLLVLDDQYSAHFNKAQCSMLNAQRGGEVRA